MFIRVHGLIYACFIACPDSWSLQTDYVCYKLLNKEDGNYANIYEARQACLAQGSDIANIPDATIDTFIRDAMRNLYPTEVRKHSNKIFYFI